MISADSDCIEYELEDGTKIIKKFNHVVDRVYDANSHVAFALAVALLDTMERVADLERMIKD
jgi:hypothetical protein